MKEALAVADYREPDMGERMKMRHSRGPVREARSKINVFN